MKTITTDQWEFLLKEIKECHEIAGAIYKDVGNEASIELSIRLEHLLKQLEKSSGK